MTPPQREARLCRRNFLSIVAKVTLCAGISAPLNLHSAPALPDRLKFYHIHTRENFELFDHSQSATVSHQKDLNNFLRDFRTGEVYPIDFRLMDILGKIQQKTRSRGTFEVISGFRSGVTNDKLRSQSRGVASKSLHLVGQAIDVRLTDLSTRDLRDAAISLHAGGVGYYPKSDFVHIDTGRVRTW